MQLSSKQTELDDLEKARRSVQTEFSEIKRNRETAASLPLQCICVSCVDVIRSVAKEKTLHSAAKGERDCGEAVRRDNS